MSLEIMLTVAITAAIQLVFGAGSVAIRHTVYAFFGYPFVGVLNMLLPVSLAIKVLQTTKQHAHIDLSLLRKVMLLTLPLSALFLFLVTHVRINIGLIIGSFLLFIALKSISPTVTQILDRLMR
jgi:uncharacterized protein